MGSCAQCNTSSSPPPSLLAPPLLDRVPPPSPRGGRALPSPSLLVWSVGGDRTLLVLTREKLSALECGGGVGHSGGVGVSGRVRSRLHAMVMVVVVFEQAKSQCTHLGHGLDAAFRARWSGEAVGWVGWRLELVGLDGIGQRQPSAAVYSLHGVRCRRTRRR